MKYYIKKINGCIYIFMCMSLFSAYAGEWVQVAETSQPAGTPPSLSVQERSGEAGGYVIQLDVSGFEQSSVTIEGQSYDIVTIPTWEQTMEEGMPSLPGRIVSMEIPPYYKPDVRVTNLERVEVQNMQLAPVQPMNGSDPVKNAEFYASQTVYPSNALAAVGVTWARNHKVLMIQLAPVQYRPAAGVMTVTRSMTIDVGLVPDPDDQLPLDGDLDAMASPLYDAASGAGIHGFDYFESGPEYMPKYMILTFDEFATNPTVQAFADWKRRKGMDVRIVKASEIPDAVAFEAPGYNWSNKELWYDLTYDTWSEQLGYMYSMPASDYPDFLLILGDASQSNGIPGDVMDWTVEYWYRTYGDSPLANHTLHDELFYNIPDLFYGRIPATNQAELTVMLGQAMEMDRYPPAADQPLYDRITLAGMCDESEENQMMFRNLETVDGAAEYFEWTTQSVIEVSRIWDKGNASITTNCEWSPYSLLWQGAVGDDERIGDRVYTNLLTSSQADGLFAQSMNKGSILSVHYGAESNGRNYQHTLSSGVRELYQPSFTVDEARALTNGSRRTLFMSLSGDARNLSMKVRHFCDPY